MEAQGQGALSGVRVVDFGQFIAGPMFVENASPNTVTVSASPRSTPAPW